LTLPYSSIIGIIQPKNILHCKINNRKKAIDPFGKPNIVLLVEKPMCLIVVVDMQLDGG